MIALMDIYSLLRSHRSIRKFTDEAVGEDLLSKLVEAGMAAATSSNLQGTTAIRIRSTETRAAIARLAGGQQQVETAAAFFVWCADLHRSAQACKLGGRDFSPGMTEHFIISIIDCALAAQNTVVAAEAHGLGTCYIGGIRNDLAQVAELLNLPRLVFPAFGMCIGWPAQDPTVKPRLPLKVTLKEETYDFEGDLAHIEEYDHQMREYYLSRTGGKKDTAWTTDMSKLLGKQSRPHTRDFLDSQGLSQR